MSHLPFSLLRDYASLPERLYKPHRFPDRPHASLIHLNQALSRDLALDPDHLASESGIAFLSGQTLPSEAKPLAMAYAGHQFGVFVPSLGDGRAALLGEIDDRSAKRHDLHIKGAGRTAFARSGDGKAALGPILREYLLSAFMAAVNIPTTQVLAVLLTGENVMRLRPLPGAALVRTARSHVRVGTFEYAAARGDEDAIDHLVAFALHRLGKTPHPEPDPSRTVKTERREMLLDLTIARQCHLIAKWMAIGFIHGVMNTDNVAISGETLDYGPCAFMDHYDPEKVFSSIDIQGRYRYDRQPLIGAWNARVLASALWPSAPDRRRKGDEAAERFQRLCQAKIDEYFAQKIGLGASFSADDKPCVDALLQIMAAQKADFTETFRRLSFALDTQAVAPQDEALELFDDPAPLSRWIHDWRERLGDRAANAKRQMRATNPVLIPRNHRIEKVLDAAERGEWKPFLDGLALLQNPFDAQANVRTYQKPPRPEEVVKQTFCGT